MPKCNFRLEKSMIEEETGEKRPMVLTDAIQVIECTWVRELDGADKDQPGELSGYEGPYHDFNGITSKFGAHFILKVDKILMRRSTATHHQRRRGKGFSSSPGGLWIQRQQELLVPQKGQDARRAPSDASGRWSRFATRQTAQTIR